MWPKKSRYRFHKPATMREIRAWAKQIIPGSDVARAEIIIDPERARLGEESRYELYYHINDVDRDVIPWMKSCFLTQKELKWICTGLMRLDRLGIGNG